MTFCFIFRALFVIVILVAQFHVLVSSSEHLRHVKQVTQASKGVNSDSHLQLENSQFQSEKWLTPMIKYVDDET